jgi:hypothetical protein
MATQDQIDAAVAVVEAHATAAMGGVPDDLGYSSAHIVAKELEADPDQAAAGEAEEAAVDEMALLYERGVVAGLPRPVMLRSSGPDDPGAVMYDAAGFKALVELAEGAEVSAQAASVGP